MGGERSVSVAASSEMQEYFNDLQKELDNCYKIAEKARKKGLDPELKVEIPQALDLAARVEELVGPKNISEEIRKVTKKIGNRELVSLEIAKSIASDKKYKFKNREEALDQATRTGLAILTEGVLVAPLEGIGDVKLGKNNDGTDYVDLYFSGPIRSAGGTGQAMSVLIADVVRREMNIDRYKPTSGEIERYKEEIPLYKRAQHLQYTPSVDEIHKIVSGCPICVNGEGTEDVEVTGYRDLPRVETNRLRGGACLVIAEGLCLKAPKLLKHVKKLKLKGWDFLETFVNKGKSNDTEQKNGIPEIPPSKKYIGEVIAGRPVFSHPSRIGGFRLRYGRARTAGLASTAINPASMYILDEFIALGTQLKTERPGKGTIGTPCSTIEGPIVLMNNGDLVQINHIKEYDLKEIKKIIDLGEILIPFGEFIENNSLLPDSSYVYEWWIQDLQKSLNIKPKKLDTENIQKVDGQTQKTINESFSKEIDIKNPIWEEALQISKKYKIPLHPNYNLFWHDIKIEDLKKLSEFILKNGQITNEEEFEIPLNKEIKDILIELGALHKQTQDKIILSKFAKPLIYCSGLKIEEKQIKKADKNEILYTFKEEENTTSIISKILEIKVMNRAPFRIGTRMGRPEKAAARKMRPPPHVLFPIGNYGGNQRLIRNAAELPSIEIEAGTRKCIKCGKKTYRLFCSCGGHTEIFNDKIETHDINLSKELTIAKNLINERTLPDSIKGVIGTISKNKTPEPLEKGILRAKHQIYVFKDGTIRFDMTDAPLTHFKPSEIGVSVKRLKQLGYTHDFKGDELVENNQICELKTQDVIISKSCAEYFIQVTKFIDDLLLKFYKLDRYYKIRKLENLTGHLAIGLAPHTSSGSLSRIIGFTDAQVCFAHPFYHAAKRRNCFDYDQRVFLYDSVKDEYLTEKIGDLVEKNAVNNETRPIDAYGTIKINLPNEENIYSYAIDSRTGLIQKKKVKCFIKGKTNKWIKIKTSTNREFKVTPDHLLMIIKNDKKEVIKAKDLQEGDKVPLATKNPIETKIKTINFSEQLSFFDEKIISDIKIRKAEDFFRQIVTKIGWKKIQKICKINNSVKNSSSKWIRSVPLLHFKRICDHEDYDHSDLPDTARLGFRRDHINIPVYVRDTEKLSYILGIYSAEGWSRANDSSYHVSFRICNKEIHEKILQNMFDLFELKPYIIDSKITYSSRLLHLIFISLWKAGSNAYEKNVPELIYHFRKESIIKYISGYFDGDGSISLKPDRVTFYSVSNRMLEGVANLLLRLDIVSRYQKIKKRKPGKTVLNRYLKLGKKPVFHQLYHLVLTGEDRYRFAGIVEPVSKIKKKRCSKMFLAKPNSAARLINYKGRNYAAVSFSDYTFDIIKEIEIEKVYDEPTYCFDVEGEDIQEKAVLWHNQLFQIRCDGDEDGLMLLMDALLNFSHSYIPDKRGGRMDLPLVLTTRLDPSEVDKEAHNVDTLFRYPLELYEATLRHEHSKELEDKMDLVSSRLGTKFQYEGFGFTHDTDDISNGPKLSNYKTLKTMMDKMNAQLNLAKKIRAVDEADVAYKVIERHFLPDMLGNLRAFSKQSVRCPTCNITYRRPPLKGVCTKCNGKLTLTVHEKSVKKYLEISKEVAKKYNISHYAQQRIVLVEKSINSLFMSDKVKTMRLDDYL